MFFEPPTTEWDLRWRMFGIPVRVHPLFWLVSLLMGQSALQQGVEYLLAWVACVFVSILIHELGHAVMGRLYGSRSQIVLYAFGGLAIGSNRLNNRWERIAVCLAGPIAGFLFLGVIFGLLWLRDPMIVPVYFSMACDFFGIPIPLDQEAFVRFHEIAGPLEFSIVMDLIFINLMWGLINLLPIWPLDGGQVSRELCEMNFRRGTVVSLNVSIVFAAFLSVCAILDKTGHPILPFRFGTWYTALLFGYLAWQSYQMLQYAQAPGNWTNDHWDRED